MTAALLSALPILAASSPPPLAISIVIGILGFVVAFGLAIFVHELGHFLAAKAFGVSVERFVIGFDKEAIGFLPKCIWEKKLGETTYGLSLVPLGGYVKMTGVVHPEIERYLEGEESSAPARTADSAREPREPIGPASAAFEQARQSSPQPASKTPSLQEQAMTDMAALYRKPFWQKIIIYGAGVFMNMLLAAFVMAMLFSVGFEDSAPFEPRVGWMSPENTFRDSPIQTGDRVLSVDGEPIENANQFYMAIERKLEGRRLGEDIAELPVVLTLARDGETYEYELVVRGDESFWAEFGEWFPLREPYIDFVIPNTPADRAGIRRGDLVVSIDGEPIIDWSQFRHVVGNAPGRVLSVELQRGEEILSVNLTPWEDADTPGRGQVGVVVGNARREMVREPVVAAFAAAPGRVYNMTRDYVSRLGSLGGKLAQGNVTAVSRELGGPVGIAQIAYRMAQHGFSDWLRFLIILNVALAVMNILPFPVLDGGHIVFAFYEALFRRPVPARVLVPLLNGAVIFILVFFVLVTFNDVRKFFF